MKQRSFPMPEAIDYFEIQNMLNRYSEAVDRGAG